MTATSFVPTQYFRREPHVPVREPDPVVTRHEQHIRTTYEKKGGAAAAVELSKVMTDSNLDAEQRTSLLTQLRPITDEVASQLGRQARRTDLPDKGASGATVGIDDKQEYQLTLAQFAAALQKGDPNEAQRLAGVLLNATPAAPKNAGADKLGLLGDGLRAVGSNGSVLRDAVIAQLRAEKPGNAPAGSELAQPQDVRLATVGSLMPTVNEPYKVPDGSEPAALRAYTDWAVKQVEDSRKLADELGKPFEKGQSPEDDPAAWEMYVMRVSAMNADQARVDVAIAAELRAVYAGEAKNKTATERRAREIAALYPTEGKPGKSRMQESIDGALEIVFTETAQQRNTHDKQYAVHRADDKLNALMADRESGKVVSDQTITEARDAFGASRRELLAAVGKELDGEIPTVRGPQLMKEDPLMVAADRIGGRYVGDLELRAALNAEVILRQSLYAPGPDGKMQALGKLMPRSLDPTTRAIVMSDPRGQGIVDDYVTWAADEVTGAYDAAVKSYDGYDRSAYYEQRLFEGTPPALAATKKLLELTDTNRNSFMKPELAARIFGELRQPGAEDKPSTMDRILDDLALDGDWHQVLLGKDHPRGGDVGSEFPTYNTVIKNLSLAMDNMGRAQDVGTGKYPPAIETEVTWLGRRFAEMVPIVRKPMGMTAEMPPYASRLDAGFKLAASEGSVILALETARQLTGPDAPKLEFEPYPEWDRHAQANLTVKFVREGIDDFNKNSKELFNDANKNMAPVSSPIARFGMNMTEEQLQEAVTAVFSDGPNGEKIYQQMLKDREAMDLRGYQLVRLGETVTFYRQPLGQLSEYGGVVKSRDGMLDSKENISMVTLSNNATLAIGAKTAMNMLSGTDHANGSLLPQKYSWVAQTADFSEYWAETYLLKQRGVEKQTPGGRTYGIFGDPAQRFAHYEMPPAMRNAVEKMYNSGEARENTTPNERRGTYRRYSHMPFIQEGNYEATRLGRFPLAGAAVWGGGGYAQVKLWNYIHNEVGMNKGEEWRKPFLEGTVGGFAAFHLLEAGVALSRAGADSWYAMKNAGWLKSFEQNAPLVYRKFDSAVAREEAWARFSVTGTKSLTAGLAGLMAIASVWDISGVVYRIQDGHVEHQGMWGSKWWKTGTHAVNAVSDVLLLRLQVQEFAKRAVPGMVEAGVKEGLTNGAKSLSASRLISWAGSRPLTANPIGFWVNVAYLGTTGVNWVVDQHRYIKDLEQYDNVFLRGAGIQQPQADLLKRHAFWTGDGKGDGFALGYNAVGGDPAKFIDYLNALDPDKLAAAIGAMNKLPEHVQQPDKQPALPVSHEYYLSLPRDGKPAANDPRFVFNERADRFEDAYTHMYYHDGKWLYAGPKDADPGADQLVSFDPTTRKVTKTDGVRTWEEQIFAAGLRHDDPSAKHLALPDDPTQIEDWSAFPTVSYNADKKRYEDSATGLYFDLEDNKDARLKAWRREDDLGSMGYYYYPTQQRSAYYWPMGHDSTDMHPTGVEGARAYLQAHGMMPPLA